MDMKPIFKARFFSLFENIAPLWGSISHMIKYCVQHNADSSSMTFLNEFTEELFITEGRINL